MRWLKGRRPPEPAGWRAKVRDAEERVRKALARRAKELDEKEESELFECHWTDAKEDYARAQEHKCGYCEAKVTSDHAGGAVDHYRPKGQIEEIVAQGRQRPNSTRIVSGSRRATARRLGYWWLAYAWDNYVLSCGDCNSRWKLCAFPIEGGHQRAPTRASVKKENALLLDPYGAEDPAMHLRFTEFGAVVERKGSAHGKATIATCNLDRDTLCKERGDEAGRVKRWLNQIQRIDAEPAGPKRAEALAVAREAVQNILDSARDARPFCGMVRSLTCDELRLARWDEFGPDVLPDS